VRKLARESDPRPLPVGARLALAAEVLGVYGIARWALARHGAPVAVARLRAGAGGDRTPGPPPDPATAVRAGLRLGSAVERTLRFMPADSRCLVRSLVLVRMLARRGIAGTMVIGVRTEPTFEAHAWVEHAGRPLLAAGDYARLTEL
jgi:Transglutaminase-like superfamily